MIDYRRIILNFSLWTAVVFTAVACTTIPVAYAAFSTNCADTATTGIPQIGCEALRDLYSGTNGDNWTNNTNWGTNTAVSTW